MIDVAGEVLNFNVVQLEKDAMDWWQNSSNRRDLEEALSYLNQAMDERAVSAPRGCELYFHGLSKLWNAHARNDGEQGRADTPAFVKLLQELPADCATRLLESLPLQGLCELTPQILDHSVLKARGYRAAMAIGPALRREASERHRKLKTAWSSYNRGGSLSSRASLLKKLAELLFVVRSNVAHGEKTPYGPDLEKARRDERVCRKVLPLLTLLVDLLLDRPSQKLVAYGTLRPGEKNASLLKNIPDPWLDCTIQGRILENRRLPFFSWDPQAKPISAKLLISEALPEAWNYLDRFEGARYRRHLIPAEANGVLHVANIYEARKQGRTT